MDKSFRDFLSMSGLQQRLQGGFLNYSVCVCVCVPEWDTGVCTSHPRLCLHFAETTSPHRNDLSRPKCNPWEVDCPCEVPVSG